MSLMTVAELQTHISTTLGSDALQDKIDAAEQEIIRAIGPVGPVTEYFARVSGPLILLSRRAVEITTVVEGTTTLSADDYSLNGIELRRISTGTNPAYRWRTYWHNGVSVTYVPETDLAERRRVAIALIQLDLGSSGQGLAQQRIGDWWEQFDTSKDPAELRADILSTLNQPGPLMF